jgi:hypothetical protein
MTTREEVVAVARSFKGTPFHHQGRLPGVGLDCAGVLICVGRTLQLVGETFDVNGYRRLPDGETMQEWCDRHMTRIESPELGGAVLVAIDQDPQHLGIVGDYRHGGLSIIHAASKPDGKGRVIESRLMFAQNMKLIAAYRLPGVE